MKMRSYWVASACVFLAAAGVRAGDAPSLEPKPAATQKADTVYKPFTYRDAASKITLFVETNGRVMAAIDAEGKLLWYEDILKLVHTKEGHGRVISHLDKDLFSPRPASGKLGDSVVPEGSMFIGVRFAYPGADNQAAAAYKLGDFEAGMIDLRTGKYTFISVFDGDSIKQELELQGQEGPSDTVKKDGREAAHDAPPAGGAQGEAAAGETPAFKPIVYKDAGTGIVIYLETNGRRLAATEPDGKLLWHANIYDQVKPQARGWTPNTRVTMVSKPMDWMLKTRAGPDVAGVSFNNKEMGILNLRTGYYLFIGSD